MEMTFSKNVGKNTYTFTVDGKNMFELLQASQHFGFQDVYKCGLCESDLLYLRSYLTKDDGYEYVKVHCGKCKATLTFGKAKKDGAFFLRKNDNNSYAWKENEQKGEAKKEVKKAELQDLAPCAVLTPPNFPEDERDPDGDMPF